MNKLTTLIKLLSIMSLMFFAITACDSDDGTIEKMGQKIDKTATDMGNKVEDACEDLKEGLNANDPNC